MAKEEENLPLLYLQEDVESFPPKQIGALSESSLSPERASHDELEQTDYDLGSIGTSRQEETGEIMNESQREVNQLKRLCAPCKEDNDGDESEVPLAVMHCLECSDICKRCCDSHRKFKPLKHHQLIEIGEFYNSYDSVGPNDVMASGTLALIMNPTVLRTESVQERTILLIGETGVGKSTFINAFANYLKFESFEEAVAQEKPECLISTYFHVFNNLVQVQGKNFKNNTEGMNPQECGTLRPSTYEFRIGNWIIQFIDTPGINDTRGKDTRGLSYEKINFTQVSSYLKECKSLHGIIMLLKPDQQKLTENFKSLIITILGYFNKDAIRNIVFCFTNAKNDIKHKYCETQNTVSQYFEKIPVTLDQNKQFYYVDNEAFKYLCARYCKVDDRFDGDDIHSFRRSWEQSRSEMCRMMEHVFNLTTTYVQREANSVREYENRLERLAKAVGLVAIVIQENIETTKVLKEKLAIYQRVSDGMEEAKEDLKIENIVIKPIKYSYPRLVCKSKTCRQLEQSLIRDDLQDTASGIELGDIAIDSGTNATIGCAFCRSSPSSGANVNSHYCIEARSRTQWEKIKYKLRLFNTRCNFEIEIGDNSTTGENERSCTCNVRRGCGCKYKDHTIASYEILREVIKIEIESYDQHIKRQHEELKEMFKNVAIFSKYVKNLRWFPSDDPMEKFFLRYNTEENDTALSRPDTPKKSLMKKIENLYKTFRDIINDDPTTAAEFEEIENNICSLTIYGRMVKQILRAEEERFKFYETGILDTKLELTDEKKCYAFLKFLKGVVKK